MMERCQKCTACIKSCPTKAISNERFLIQATRCLTYLNEGIEEFPQWIDAAWRNFLIGCMVFHDVCPANKELTNLIFEVEDFSENETLMILNTVPWETLPTEMIKKLTRLFLFDDYALLRRNLSVILSKSQIKITIIPRLSLSLNLYHHKSNIIILHFCLSPLISGFK